jgi:hypothetical protein
MRALAGLIPVSALALPLVAAAAPDCDGGRVFALRLRPDRVRFAGSITRPGLTHGTLVTAPTGLQIEIFDANDPGVVLYSATIPANEFVTRGPSTRYNGDGAFEGRVSIRNSRRQDDTVRISIRARNAVVTGLDMSRELRARVVTDGGCARTCVSACTVRNGLHCTASAIYVPFADEGFGAYATRPPGPTSSLCGLEIDAASSCDFLLEERCILPYPSSHFLVADGSTPTGLRLQYPPDGLPATTSNVHVDPTDWNTLDGYSPGPMIMALFPDNGVPVDLGLSQVAFHTNYARSLDADHPTVVMKAATGDRIVHFAEMDANTNDVTKKALIIRPGRRLEDGTRYIVAIRSLVDTQSHAIRPRLAFRALRDGGSQADIARACGTACAAAIGARLPAFANLLQTLDQHGVDPAELILAWDFTTASTQALTGWIVSIRDQAFALPTPTFTVTTVDDGATHTGFNANIWARVSGTFQAPLFMRADPPFSTQADSPATRLNLVNGVPTQNGYATVPYVVDIPRIAVNGAPARPTLWGHGLLGSRTQVGALSLLANTYNFVVGGVDMQGMSSADLAPAILPIVTDFSNFHYIPERLHQGFLNHLLLGRLLGDPVNGFNSHPAFQLGAGGAGVIDTTEVFYSGGSQGGIFGIAIMSIATNFKRGFLAVPAANYSTLLHRSIDFNPYLSFIRGSYPDRLDEQLLVALSQQLWDRAEPQGYMPHLLSGDLSTPPVPHKVLIHMATYDSEVANVGTEIMVRSLGIEQVTPVHRSFFQIPERAAPFDGSAFVEVDPMRGGSRCHTPGGTDAGAACTTDANCPGAGDPGSRTMCASGIPPLTNQPPLFNNGAHGSTGSPQMGQQIEAFLRPNGTVIQFCSGACDNPDLP